MRSISFKRPRFPPDVIRYAVWLYFRFTLSFRDVEELLAQRGIEVSYETIRCWTIKFGPQIAENLKRKRPPPSPRWHLDEMVCRVGGKRMYLWRAVDDEGEVLDLMMETGRDSWSAIKLIGRLIENQRTWPERITTDGHPSYAAALKILDIPELHRPGRLRENNRAENSHLPIRRREQKDAEVQIPSLSPAFPHHPRSDLQHLQHPTTSRPRSTLRKFRAEAHAAWIEATAAA